MKVSSKQSIVRLVLFGIIFAAFSSYVSADNRTRFDDSLAQLKSNAHHIFSAQDAHDLSGDPRFQAFLNHYNRYTLVKDPLPGTTYGTFFEKDTSSALICNAFLRWTALNGGDLAVAEMTNKELEDALLNISYLTHAFYPQVHDRNGLSPDMDAAKVTRLNCLRSEILLEIESRNSLFTRGVVAAGSSDPKPALWVLGDQYDRLAFVSWDASGRYLMCMGYKGEQTTVLIYAFDAATLGLSLCASMAVSIEGFPEFNPTHLLWGGSSGLIILGGNSPDRRHSITCSFMFNSAKNTIYRLGTVQQIAGYEAASRQAFWSSDMSSLCIVKAGQCDIFRWDKASMTFSLDKVIYPGLRYVMAASWSCNMSYFLTSHLEAPHLRLSRVGDALGAYSYAQFTDRLIDPQWNPKSLYFVARSQIEADVIVLYQYNPSMDRVVFKQRIHAGAAINSLAWSPDGSYLFVMGDASLLYGSGLRAYAFDGNALQLCSSLDDSTLGITQVSECAYLPAHRALVIAGKAHDFASGVVVPLKQSTLKKSAQPEAPVVPKKVSVVVSEFAVSDAQKPVDPSRVYQYLDEVPSERTVGFGSVIMLASVQDVSRGLVACDAPEIRCVHNGKPFPCARTTRKEDVNGMSLSSWWIVEGASWLDRLDKPVKPFAQITLKNLATGEKLCCTDEHAPINGTMCAKKFVSLSKKEDVYLSLRQADNSCSPWLTGSKVSLTDSSGRIAMGETAENHHPILQSMGIAPLVVAPLQHDASQAAEWVVSRNIPLSTIFSQALKGSECCDFLLKRIDALWGKDLKAVVTKSLEAGLSRGV
jgi:hypothetical protein